VNFVFAADLFQRVAQLIPARLAPAYVVAAEQLQLGARIRIQDLLHRALGSDLQRGHVLLLQVSTPSRRRAAFPARPHAARARRGWRISRARGTPKLLQTPPACQAHSSPRRLFLSRRCGTSQSTAPPHPPACPLSLASSSTPRLWRSHTQSP